VVLQGHKPGGSRDVKIVVDSIPPGFIAKIPGLQGGLTDSLSGYLKSSKQFHNEQAKYGVNKMGIVLNTVVIRDRKVIKEGLEDSQNLNGKGNADQVLTAKDLENAGPPVLYQALRGRLGAVTFVNGAIYSNHSGADWNDRRGLGPPMAIIVDGMVMGEATYLVNINTTNVQSVEVLSGTRGGAVYGHSAASGAIVITTKKATIGKYVPYAPGVLNYKAIGYYKAREFYSPHYDDPKVNKYMPDMRSTIYWNPDVLTDENGKAVIAYFNADSPGTYRVVIEGIDADGNLGRQVYRYKVE
jgi:hypothetical protein